MAKLLTNTASFCPLAGLLLGVAVALCPSLCIAGSKVVFRSEPRLAKPQKLLDFQWGYRKVGRLSDSAPEAVTHVIYSQCWALLVRQQPGALWAHAASRRDFPSAWRNFAAYQLFMARVRPGETLAQIASLYSGTAWLHRQMLQPVKAPAALGNKADTVFSIQLRSPGEPGGRLLIALAGKQSLSVVYRCLKGKQPAADLGERVVAIGVSVRGPEFRFQGLPVAARTLWLTEPAAIAGRSAPGQTLDRWAIRHYVRPTEKKSARRTAVVAALSMAEMPSKFWAALARDHGLTRPERRFAEVLFLVTGIKPGELLGHLVHQMHGFPRLHGWQVENSPGGTGLPPFRSGRASRGIQYWLFPTMRLSERHSAGTLNLYISVKRQVKTADLRACLNGHGRKSILADTILDLIPHWQPYPPGFVSRAVKAAEKK